MGDTKNIQIGGAEVYSPIFLESNGKIHEVWDRPIDYLVKQGNGSCTDLLDENINTVTVLKTLPKDLMDRGILLPEAIKSALKNDYRLPNEFEVLPMLITIFDRLRAKYGNSFDIALDNPRDPDLKAEDVCVIYRQLFVDLLQLPVAEREMALRYMTSP